MGQGNAICAGCSDLKPVDFTCDGCGDEVGVVIALWILSETLQRDKATGEWYGDPSDIQDISLSPDTRGGTYPNWKAAVAAERKTRK